MKYPLRAAVAALAVGSTLLTPSIAHAGGGETLEEGACSGAATWKLKVDETADGRLEMEYEVDVNRRGQQWRVVLFHNGTAVMRRTFTTGGLSGSFEARMLRADADGDDTFRGRAVRVSDGQTCGGRAVVQD
jgi:hypothetical protein